jgi:glycogen synthase
MNTDKTSLENESKPSLLGAVIGSCSDCKHYRKPVLSANDWHCAISSIYYIQQKTGVKKGEIRYSRCPIYNYR